MNNIICTSCQGTGTIYLGECSDPDCCPQWDDNTCWECAGTGRIEEEDVQ